MKSSLRNVSRLLVIALVTTLVPAHLFSMEEVQAANPLVRAIQHNLQNNANAYPHINENIRRIFNDQRLTDAELLDGIHHAREAFDDLGWGEKLSLALAVTQQGLNPLATQGLLNLDALQAIPTDAERNQAMHLCLHNINDYLQVDRIRELLEQHLNQAHERVEQGRTAQAARAQVQQHAADAQAQAQAAAQRAQEAAQEEAQIRAQEQDLEAQIAALQQQIAQDEAQRAAEQREAEARQAREVAARAQEVIARANQQRAAFEEQERIHAERQRAQEEAARNQQPQEILVSQPVEQAQESEPVENNNNNFADRLRERYEREQREQQEREQAEQAREAQDNVQPVVEPDNIALEPVSEDEPIHVEVPDIDIMPNNQDDDSSEEDANGPVVGPAINQPVFIDNQLDNNVQNPVEPVQQPVVHEQARPAAQVPQVVENRPVLVPNAPANQPAWLHNLLNREPEPAAVENNPAPAPAQNAVPQVRPDLLERLAALRAQQAAAHERAQQAERAHQEAEQAREQAEQENQRAQQAAQAPAPAPAVQNAPNAPIAPQTGFLGTLTNLWNTIKGKAQEHPIAAAAIGIAAAFGLYKLISWFTSDDDDEEEDVQPEAPVRRTQDPDDKQDAQPVRTTERAPKTTTIAPESPEARKLAAKRKRAQLRREFFKKRGRCCKSRCKRRCR